MTADDYYYISNSRRRLRYFHNSYRPSMPISGDKTQVAVIMTKDLKEALKTYADTHHWSLSQAANLLIQEGINQWQKENSVNKD